METEEFGALREVACIRRGQTRQRGIFVEEFDRGVRRIEAEDEMKRAGRECGTVPGGRERFAGLGELHFEAEEIRAQQLAGFGACAGHGDGGLVGADATLDSDDGLPGFAEIQRGTHDCGDESMVRSAEIEIGGFGAGLGGMATSRRATAGVEIVGNGAGGVEVVDVAGPVEIETEVKGALVEDGTEGHHRAVGVGVAAGKGNLRAPGGLGLVDHGFGGLHAGPGDAGVGVAFEGGGDSAVERPRLSVESRRKDRCGGER